MADLYARSGEFSSAITSLAQVTANSPGLPWAAAPWFGPHLADTVPGGDIGQAVYLISGKVDDPAPAGLVAALTPWLDLARAVAARADTDWADTDWADANWADVNLANAKRAGAGPATPAVPLLLSGLARRLGAHAEAIAWCEEAERREHAPGGTPGSNAPIMLGYALRSAGRPHDAIAAWERALAAEPGNVELHIDLAETCMRTGDYAGAVAWAERAEKIDPRHLKPKAVKLAAAYQAADGSDGGPLVALVDLARANPEHGYPRTLIFQVCTGRPWLGRVPLPTEAIAGAAAQLAEDKPDGEPPFPDEVKLRVSAVEAPSAVAAFRSWFPNTELEVTVVPEPDARRPARTDLGPALWTYEGTDARPAVPAASPLAAEALYKVATGYFPDPLTAYDAALGLAGLDEAELLGLLARVPPAPASGIWLKARRVAPCLWPRVAQAWVCVGILHHRADEPWEGTARRAMLLRLLFGPEDWTVDAAAFALCVSAWIFPEQRAEVATFVGERYLSAAKAVMQRACELHDPLAHIVLACPGMLPDVAALARDLLARRARADAVGESR
jgi:tetratricopeptide (TPR) repeat protein